MEEDKRKHIYQSCPTNCFHVFHVFPDLSRTNILRHIYLYLLVFTLVCLYVCLKLTFVEVKFLISKVGDF